LVTPGGEQGLLSLAFSPNYQQDSRVYLYYTEGSPNPSDLVRFTATPEGGVNFVSKEVLLQVEQPYANHNGGHIVFGNDGDLYIGFGDGGSENDPNDEGQDMTTDLSKIIRIDVSGQTGYTVPADNPFVGQSGVKPEIYALGFRNPFRISIDPVTGDLWVGDVGQDAWEEVDRVVKGGNYGWSCYEGFVQFSNYHDAQNSCAGKTFQSPRAVYGHDDGNQAVTGGVIYRGASMPELYGYYIYADFYSGNVWAVNTNDNSPAVQLISHLSHNISDFVLAASGEAYLMTYGDGLYQLSR
jgi:glucose/arabinose dehydrogenase